MKKSKEIVKLNIPILKQLVEPNYSSKISKNLNVSNTAIRNKIAGLLDEGLIKPHHNERRRQYYILTQKGLDLLGIFTAIGNTGVHAGLPKTHKELDLETGEYVESQATSIWKYSFYLRFLKQRFSPCMHCQQQLHDLLNQSNMIIGNESYVQPIELNRKLDFLDDWKEIERRPATDIEKVWLKSYV